MLAAILWFVASAIFVDFVGYWLHRWSHRPWSPLYRPHMTHHVINYPPRSFFSTKYRSSGSDGLAIWFVPFGILYAAAVILLNAPHQIAILSGGATVAVLSSISHELTHISNSIIWKNRFLVGIAARHHLHHFKMGRNFGIIVPWWDIVFQTRRQQGSSYQSRNQPYDR